MSPKRDGKDKFYRTLKLDKDTRKILKDYKQLKEKMDRDGKPLEDIENE